ncbi:hypothetical protein [Nodularia sphaerocarpa]|uniref:hypothetical protein n=1 Tax=Nodularia sphaerocarpa TaxID=137816 RepID=UPI00232C0316|nr:hypothetical protein [Nodularia sphaerocarpa]MDB9372356.1 hypothetical protein [Nodularia sphaerocarpa CS-585]MDB9377972.1 hypothetical protein [Nodularia sphaerocarpa CS-585A2]
MKKIILLFTLLISAYPLSAIAVESGYFGSDGFFSIKGLEPYKSYVVDFGGMPLIRAGTSNSCGVLRIAGGGAVKVSDRIEIHDVGANKFYGFENSNIPVKDYRCTPGTVETQKDVWKDSRGTIFISGLTPSSGQTIRLLSDNPKRKIRSNGCGFISIRLGDPKPLAILVEETAFVIPSQPQGGGINCRRSVAYSSFPAPQPVQTQTRQQWKISNILEFKPYTSIASFNQSTSIPIWTVPATTAPPLRSSNNSTPTPPSPPPLPSPPRGSICKINGENSIFVKDLIPNTLYEFSDQEYLRGSYPNYRSQSSDSLGNTTLLNMNFSTISRLDGDPSQIVLYKDGEYVRVLGSVASVPQCN